MLFSLSQVPAVGNSKVFDLEFEGESLLLVAMPFVPSNFSFLVVRPGATSSVLALVAMPLIAALSL